MAMITMTIRSSTTARVSRKARKDAERFEPTTASTASAKAMSSGCGDRPTVGLALLARQVDAEIDQRRNRHTTHGCDHWAADGALTLFFFVAGLELKREVVARSLRRPADALVPVVAALCGVAIPALIYLGVNLASRQGRPVGGDPRRH